MKDQPLRSFANLDKAILFTKTDKPTELPSPVQPASGGISASHDPRPQKSFPEAYPLSTVSQTQPDAVLSERLELEESRRKLEIQADDLKRREDVLQHQKDQLEQNRQSIQGEASRKQAELSSRASQLVKEEQSLDLHKKENYRRKNELDTLSLDLNSRKEKVEAAEQALEARIRSIEEREAACAEIAHRAKALESENSELSIIVGKHETKIESLEEKYGKLREKLKAAKAELDEVYQNFNRVRHAHQKEINDLNKELSCALREIDTLSDFREKLKGVSSKLKEANRRINELKASLADTEASAFDSVDPVDLHGQFYLSHPSLIDLLTSDWPGEPFSAPKHVTVLGEGPIETNQWLAHLEAWGCEAWQNGNEWIIIGREGWNPEDIDSLVAERVGQSIRVVSQEMFLAAMISGHDPFDAEEDLLLAFAEGHPALQYLIDSPFEWPFFEEDLPQDGPQNFDIDAVEKSPLKLMGYTVGKNGLDVRPRRKILKDAYQGEIPWVDPSSYMEEWGRARTRRRLWRMAHHLSWLIRKASGKDNMDQAIFDWGGDLDWLYDEFYGPGGMGFRWPDSDV